MSAFNFFFASADKSRLRKSRGKDIDAACGQLANKEVK
jgi:adenine C2-methylase RlmN of 23S rRNA A2503 and tRNA A37